MAEPAGSTELLRRERDVRWQQLSSAPAAAAAPLLERAGGEAS